MKKTKKLIVAWYKSEQWPRLLEISADADALEVSYDEWRSFTEKALKDFASRGVFLEKVVVDIDDLFAWCQERNLPVNGESRSRYAAWLLKKKEKGTGKTRS